MFNPPTLEDLQKTRRANEKLVLEALDSKPEWVETELAKTTGLALSHLRAALASLLDQGRVRRLPGTGTRAVYGLADPGLADVPATPLTEDALRVREYLEGRADTALYMSEQLRLTREEVMAAVSLLNAHGMINCTFVGSLVIFRLKEQQALDAETAAEVVSAGLLPEAASAPAESEAAKPAKKSAKAAPRAKKPKAEAEDASAEAAAPKEDAEPAAPKRTKAKAAPKASTEAPAEPQPAAKPVRKRAKTPSA